MNLKAICGVGISALITGFTGVAEAGAAIYQACDKIPKATDRLRRLLAFLKARRAQTDKSLMDAFLDIEATSWLRRDVQEVANATALAEDVGDISARRLLSPEQS
mmetsp:Transcript_4874/g.6284  ORF Transcript_4874/g.6284 Transcript_4874/m.6284 type:complete len:105 (+) Transcript_4874:1-315(+)